jgi:non-homologous end joining protein Ku
VLGLGNKEEKGKRQDDVLTFSQVLEQLEKEIQTLNDKKEYILNVEAALLFFINKKIEAKKRENQELRLEVEKQKANCVKLSSVLNASIRASYSIP